jgi:hypothetical protein
MHLSKTQLETVVKSTPSRIHLLMTASMLSVASCIWPQNSHPVNEPIQTSEVSEWDIEDIEYCTLVWTTAQIQAWIEFMVEMRSSWTIKTFIEEEMKKENIIGKVTVRVCEPTENEDWSFTYVIIRVSGVGSTEIYSKNLSIANEILYQIKVNDTLHYPWVKFE